MCQLTGVSAYRVCQLISALASLKGAAAEGPSLSDSFKRPHPARTHVSHSEHTERQRERERARTHIYRTHYISSRDARAHSHTHLRVRTLPRAAPDYFMHICGLHTGDIYIKYNIHYSITNGARSKVHRARANTCIL